MTRIDFYLLPATEEASRLNFACRLADTIWKKGHRLYVHLPDQAAAEAFNQQLWSYQPQAFVPHGLIGQHPPSPVEIGWQEEPGDHHDVLLNLDLKVPIHFSRFQRVAEIINDTEEIKKPKRKDWTFYKERGYPVQTHKMRR